MNKLRKLSIKCVSQKYDKEGIEKAEKLITDFLKKEMQDTFHLLLLQAIWREKNKRH